MNIDRWNTTKFDLDSKIIWPCPHCNNSSLYIKKENFIYDYSSETKEIVNEVYFEPEWTKFNFTGSLSCHSCNNLTMFIGIGSLEHYSKYDYHFQQEIEGYQKVFKPVFFQPVLNLFEVPENCPDIIKTEVFNSFGLFWSDFASCANKIRIAIELLMDHQKVKKTHLIKGKRKKISLHSRILSYKTKNAEIGNYLEAIKWIGNSGSHIGQLNKSDIFNAYELLELSLIKLFNKKEKELKKISSQIILRKGQRKK
jgi:hypothetical protein